MGRKGRYGPDGERVEDPELDRGRGGGSGNARDEGGRGGGSRNEPV